MTPTSSRYTKTRVTAATVTTSRGISILSITGKAFARVAFSRLETVAERVYPEAQCGSEQESQQLT